MRNRFSLSTLVILGLSGLRSVKAQVYHSIDDLPAVASTGTFDFIVVGGGIGGSVLANRLSENEKHTVLLIEAGPDNEGVLQIAVPAYFPQINSTYNWNYETTPQVGLNNRTMPYARGHVLGGSSSINGMVYTRGATDDYDLWGKVSGHSRWSWKSLLPWNEKWTPPAGGRNASGQYDPRYHSSKGNTLVSLPWSGPSDLDLRSLKNAELQKEFPFNLDPNSGKPIGLTWVQSTIGNGERSSAAAAYLGQKVRERPNLTILLNTYATRVLPSKKYSKELDIRTIEIAPRSGGTKRTVTAKKELILTAGAFGTPQILLNSGIGDRKDLEEVGVKTIHNLPDVGKGMSDHLTATVAWSSNATFIPTDPAAALQQWKDNRTGPLTEAVGHQIIFAKIPSNSSIFKTYHDPASGPDAAHIEITLGTFGPGVGGFIVLLTPHSRGSLKIRSNDPFDPPLIDLGFLTHPFDLLAMKEGIRMAKRWYSGPIWEGYITGFLGPDPDALPEKEFDDLLKAGAGTFWHPVGTATMSPKGAKHGVLDPDLKVKGVKGLRVVDAAAIPYVPTAHTQAAVYVLAERAADLVKDSW